MEQDGTEPAHDQSRYYPTNQMPLAGRLPDRRPAFNQKREAWLLAFEYPTARLYWSDLEQIADWAEDRGKEVLGLEPGDIRQYLALLRRRKYSENTIRRRRATWRRFEPHLRMTPP